MATDGWFFTKGAPVFAGGCGALATSCARLLLVLATSAIAVTSVTARASEAHVGAVDAARTVALRWFETVPVTARVGAEPPGACRRLDTQRFACTIGIVVLVNDGHSRRPWRCSAMALVSGVGDELRARRANTRCEPFPPLTEVADPAGQIGTAFALHANGNVSCLRAGGGRLTCVMRYRGPTATRCVGAASVPVKDLQRAAALGTPVCR
jgi:hypothetical protein